MSGKKSRAVVIAIIFLFGFATILFSVISSCSNNNPKLNAADSLIVGRRLAQQYCKSCHQFPEPDLIDKKTWEFGVLPAMAKQLKIQNYMGQYFADTTSALSTNEWQQIVSYYKKTAPQTLVIPKSNAVKNWSGFSLQRPKKSPAAAPPAMTTFLAVNPQDQQLYSADAGNNIFRWDQNLNFKLISTLPSPVTGIIFNDDKSTVNEAVVTCIGNMAPVDVAKGQVIKLGFGTKKTRQVVLTDSLPRPIQTVAADFNKDGLTDYVTCGFGHDRGGLFLLTQQPDHQYKKSVLKEAPGGTQLVSGDFNNDGFTDVMCLFSQSDEGIWMFLNNRKGGFFTQNILRFPPIYGSSSFQLADFNRDGKPDILYTAGDNSDYSRVLKPYHGVYIFTNLGNWKFKQTFFYHIDGCTKAIAADFKKAGKMDIAAIAFFADFKFNPEGGFTYLEATSNGKYLAHEVPVSAYGRWISMDVNDVNGDTYPDIILGNFSIGARDLINQKGVNINWDTKEPLIVLKNLAGKKE